MSNNVLNILPENSELNVLASIAVKMSKSLGIEVNPQIVMNLLNFNDFSAEELLKIQGNLSVALSREINSLRNKK